jgi:hypothetical protein
MSRADKVTVTIEIELPARPSFANIIFSEYERAVRDVVRSADFTQGLLMALSSAQPLDSLGLDHRGAEQLPETLVHRAAQITATINRTFI